MPGSFQFSDYVLDTRNFELRRSGRALKLEKIPMELLILLVEREGDLVSRAEIIEKIWGKDLFFEADSGINTAVSKLRQALRDDPERPKYIQTVLGKGYRFIGSINQLPPSSIGNGQLTDELATTPTVPVQTPPTVQANASIPQQPVLQKAEDLRAPKRFTALLAAIVVLAVVAGAFLAYQVGGKRAKQPAIRALAVLPLQNLSGDPGQQYLADGITEELIGRLAGIRDLRVISRTSVMRFKNTQLSVPEIAKTLGVDAVVEGSVMRDGNRIRVHAQLIRAASDEHIWSESYDRELRDVLAMDADVAQAVARKVEVTVTGEEHQRLVAVRPVSPEVYENYLKGKFALARRNSKSDIEKSIAYFNEAISKDPTYAPGYLGLATAYSNLTTVFMGGVAEEERPRALLAARKALALDPELAEAHVLIASMEETQWHWAEAASEYRRVLELRPNDAAAYSGLAWWLDCQGRAEEAVTMRRRARELDPLAISGTELAWDLFYTRRYDEATQELRSVLAVRADDAYALWVLGFTLIANHHPQDAIPELEKGVTVSNRSPALVGLLVNAYAQAGRRRDALQLLEELKKRKQTGYVPSAAFVLAYLGLNENDQTFAWLEQAYKEQSNIMQLLRVFPFFDPIRTDPRFVDLLRRVGLEQPSHFPIQE